MLAPQFSLASSLQAGALELELPSAIVCSDHRKLSVKGVAFRAASFSHTLATFFFFWLVQEFNRFQLWRVGRLA